MELGKNIIKIRKEHNLTQDDLAEKYFVTRQTISNWENGKSYPDLETLLKISDDFDISLDILLKEDREMIKKIDTSVKATKKYKNILKYVIIAACLLLFIGYKVVMINKYHWDEVEIDSKAILNDTLTVMKTNYDGKRINVDNMSFANYFEDYVDVNPETNYKVKRNKEDEVVSFYSTGSTLQYVNALNVEAFELDMDNTNNELPKTDDRMRKFLNDKGIKDDVDLLNYIKEKYYFRNTIFTFVSTMKRNYILNAFVDSTLLAHDITLLNGDYRGYIYNINTGTENPIKEIHLLKDDKQYVIVVGGKDLGNNEFITKLLSTVEFN